MKKTLIALFVAALVVPLIGQEAKVMIVEKPDSARLARAYRGYKDALKEWERVKTEVARNYTTENGKTLEGWEKVQFSADFRAIVPEYSPLAANRSYWGNWPCNSMVFTSGPETGAISPVTGMVTSDFSVGVDSSITVKEKR